MSEDPLVREYRHVRECEVRVAAQRDRVERLKAQGAAKEYIASAEDLVTRLEIALEIARRHLDAELRR